MLFACSLESVLVTFKQPDVLVGRQIAANYLFELGLSAFSDH